VAGNARFLNLRGAALAFWIACVVFLLVPKHGTHAQRFRGGPGQPQQVPVAGRTN